MSLGKPALLGGSALFDTPIPLIRPTLQVDDELFAELREILECGLLTNSSRVAAFEDRAAEFLGVAHVVALSSCTTGLMLVLRSLGISGEVVLPSFTFMASGHAALWNGLTPVFAEIDVDTANLDPAAAEAVLTARTGAVLATHVFGAPADADALEKVTRRAGIPLVFDAAHGFGAVYPDGRKVGCRGLAEVFSLSPTKTLVSGEGGLVATNDDALAAELRVAREYGNPGTYDSLFAGLNGRMTEWNALLGRRNLERLPGWLDARRAAAARYLARLSEIPGLRFQRIPAGAVSTYKDFAFRVRADEFGTSRDALVRALREENIPTRRYFDPPLHGQTAYRAFATTPLPRTELVSAQAITLPLYSHMAPSQVDTICAAIERIHGHAPEIARVAAQDGKGATVPR
ncbi:DegT/DnrJ/EryC1/StrS family aminotransferase [Amycolatopsis sp. NPDC059657]|uniref:DegT/DnrJ/EryC1/StrS family aminotransferase n=1 Tax=Amycolatopsis sp. NPDC059657 TaxID=3346899 RepID=UPI00366CE0C4